MVRRRNFVWIAAALSISAVASAQTPEELDHARGLFQEALSLEVAGDFLFALTKLQQVSKVKFTPQVRYHLARCKEHLGRLTEALGDYRVAATEARALELSDLDEFERALAALEARVPKVRLRLSAASTTVSVEMDGVRLGPGVLGESIPVDPGLRKITLIESNEPVQTVNVEAIEGRTVEVLLQGAQLAKVAKNANASSTSVATGAPAWAYVSAGIGTVAVASSIVLFVVRSQAKSDLANACSSHTCPEDMRSTWDRGKFASWAAPTAMAVGALGAGVAVWGFWPDRRGDDKVRPSSSSGNVSLGTASGFTGVRISGEF